MERLKQKLIIEQLDKKIDKFKTLENFETPSEGWTCSIRTAIRMSLRQLGQRLNISAQGAKTIEKREKDGSLTIKGLIEIGKALDMKFVYGFIPKTGSIEKMIQNKATEVATKIVLRTSKSMSLEDQEVSDDRLKQAIKDRTEEILFKMPRYLWD
jgi:predicted DNA-binding mobile mystery protein A